MEGEGENALCLLIGEDWLPDFVDVGPLDGVLDDVAGLASQTATNTQFSSIIARLQYYIIKWRS